MSGYIWHTVPVVLHAYLSYFEDFETAITAIIDCAGDTDTTAALLGALVGIHVGEAGIKPYWRQRLVEWPRTISCFKELAHRLTVAQHTKAPTSPLPYLPFTWLGILLRNLLFLALEIMHALRRLLPPY